ncbi:MAG: potassium channel family protein [Lachnospiraceae bacterium]|uniref:potassium channel family protein n=1 Tax=Parablautia sp. Marseille-Q6255 TaxID=3039593 RepID=UPI0024BD4592|nr:TrkA family potassium uptake protein [Parablautia sp. Marseille-Q6255]
MKKQYVVFGAGRFGKSIAVTLQQLGCEIIVVDKDPEVIQEIADEVSYAICANVDDQDVFQNLGLRNLDGAIIAITEDLEASIVTTMQCSEIGIPRILAKARNNLHEKILRNVGAHKIIYPEVEMGRRMAKYLVADNFADWIELSPKYSLVEMEVPRQWCGKNLIELQIREKYNLNVIGIKYGDTVSVKIDPNEKLRDDEILIVVGENTDLEKFKK